MGRALCPVLPAPRDGQANVTEGMGWVGQGVVAVGHHECCSQRTLGCGKDNLSGQGSNS